MYIFTGISNVMLLNETTQFKVLISTVPKLLQAEFADVWQNDLTAAVEERKHLLFSANAILEYYGSCVRMINVRYDTRVNSLIWTVVKDGVIKNRKRPGDNNVEAI